MVDGGRLLRLLSGITADAAFLRRYADIDPRAVASDEVTLAAIKYGFITAIEGCAKVAHHIAAAEGWPSAETNADAVGFRNLLVHQYADVDDDRTVEHLQRLGDLDAFVAAVAHWLGDADRGA